MYTFRYAKDLQQDNLCGGFLCCQAYGKITRWIIFEQGSYCEMVRDLV